MVKGSQIRIVCERFFLSLFSRLGWFGCCCCRCMSSTRRGCDHKFDRGFLRSIHMLFASTAEHTQKNICGRPNEHYSQFSLAMHGFRIWLIFHLISHKQYHLDNWSVSPYTLYEYRCIRFHLLTICRTIFTDDMAIFIECSAHSHTL